MKLFFIGLSLAAIGSLVDGGCPKFSAQGWAEPSPLGTLADGSNPHAGGYNGSGTVCGCGHGEDTGGRTPTDTSGGGGSRLSEPGEPDGGDDPPQTYIDDPGQPPMDDHGNDADTATVLLADSRVLGNVGRAGDATDWFALPAAKAGDRVGVAVEGFGGSLTVQIVRPDGTVVTGGTGSLFGTGSEVVAVTAPDAGPFYVRVTGSGDSTYTVSPTSDPLAGVTSAVDLFSAVSAQTGGTFLVRDDVNSGDPAAYVTALFNVVASPLGPTAPRRSPHPCCRCRR